MNLSAVLVLDSFTDLFMDSPYFLIVGFSLILARDSPSIHLIDSSPVLDMEFPMILVMDLPLMLVVGLPPALIRGRTTRSSCVVSTYHIKNFMLLLVINF
jgi:hypothetical protein